MLTIAYITARREPMIEWFFRSLERETRGDYSDIKVVVIDYHRRTHANISTRVPPGTKVPPNLIHESPKPTVWQGAHRLCLKEYFAAANARNTAICYSDAGYVAFVDDLSILAEGWLKAVREAMKYGYVACGAYRKVLKLDLSPNGEVSFENYPEGWDHRWQHGDPKKAVKCHSNWLFGCSVAAPVNAFLKINGWPELADSSGIGMEDCLTGMALEASGHELRYDRRMLTYESEERHHINNGQFLRVDMGVGRKVEIQPGVSHPDEAGHRLLNMLRGKTRFDNDFGPFPDLAALRLHVLAGGQFPIVNRPTHHFYDNIPLSEL